MLGLIQRISNLVESSESSHRNEADQPVFSTPPADRVKFFLRCNARDLLTIGRRVAVYERTLATQ